MTPLIRIAEPAELCGVLPYLLGYHPTRSLVVVAVQDRRVGLIQRLDLPDDDGAASWIEIARLGTRLADTGCRDGASSVLIVIYQDRADEGIDLAAVVARRCADLGVEVSTVLLVREDRVWRLGEPQSEPIAHRSPGVVTLVGAGMAPAANRTDYARLVSRVDDELSRAVALAARPQRRWWPRGPRLAERVRPTTVARVREALRDWSILLRGPVGRSGEPALTPDQIARLGLALRDPAVRDSLLAHLVPGLLPGNDSPEPWRSLVADCIPVLPARDRHDLEGQLRLRDRLCWLARYAPSPEAPDVLGSVAAHAWSTGDGTLATLAAEQALRIDPGHVLSHLVLRAVHVGVRPDREQRHGWPSAG